MSELKAYIVYIPREGVVEGLWKSYAIRIDGVEIYLKSDADKVIAELKEQIGVLEHQACKMNCMTVKLYNEACDDLIHQKYKRCLTMAKWCKYKIDTIENGYMVSSIESRYGVMTTCPPDCNPKFSFYSKWHKRWLELAEKFKKAK